MCDPLPPPRCYRSVSLLPCPFWSEHQTISQEKKKANRNKARERTSQCPSLPLSPLQRQAAMPSDLMQKQLPTMNTVNVLRFLLRPPHPPLYWPLTVSSIVLRCFYPILFWHLLASLQWHDLSRLSAVCHRIEFVTVRFSFLPLSSVCLLNLYYSCLGTDLCFGAK